MKKIITFCLCLGIFALPVLAQDILNAVKAGDREKVQELLKQNPEFIRTKDAWKNSLLSLSLMQGDFAMAKLLIESGIDVNYRREDINGSEILNAIRAGSLEILKLMLEKGADINIKDAWGHTPLDTAIFGQRKEIADFLLDKGVALNIQGQGLDRLLRAALTGGLDRITTLLTKEKDIDYKNVDGLENTFLHAAAQSGGTTFIGFLIDKGVDPSPRNIYGWTPLHYAVSGGYRNVVEALLQNGVDKKARTKDGKSPLNIAEEFGRKDILNFLKEQGFSSAPPEFPKISAPYIDPDLPGENPVLFAPGIISQPHHFEHSLVSFPVDMKTVCWADWQRAGISKIFVMENKNGLWQAPQIVHLQATNPFIAPDGKRIFFTAKRTLPDGKESVDSDIFFIQKTDTGWSDRINLGPNVNTENDELQPTVTRDGTVYFHYNADIYRSKLVAGGYSPKEKLPAPINTEANQAHPCIAPDESYLLFRSFGRGGILEPNLFFSSRNADGTWTEPVNIAQRVKEVGLFPSLTPDRKYMIFFTGGDYVWFDIGAVMKELIK